MTAGQFPEDINAHTKQVRIPEFRHHLHHRAVFPQHRTQGVEFLWRRETAGHWPVFVVDVHPAGRKAQGACVQALPQQCLHLLDLIAGGAALPRGVTHNPQSQHAVARQGCDVDTQVVAKRRQVLGEGLPVPAHPGVDTPRRATLISLTEALVAALQSEDTETAFVEESNQFVDQLGDTLSLSHSAIMNLDSLSLRERRVLLEEILAELGLNAGALDWHAMPELAMQFQNRVWNFLYQRFLNSHQALSAHVELFPESGPDYPRPISAPPGSWILLFVESGQCLVRSATADVTLGAGGPMEIIDIFRELDDADEINRLFGEARARDPHLLPPLCKALGEGNRIGEQLRVPLFMPRYEEMFDWTIEAVREELGVHHSPDFEDTMWSLGEYFDAA